MEVLTSDQMRAADRAAIVKMKISSLTLMENAGKAVAKVACQMAGEWKRRTPLKIAVLCGKGNNGGDGLVAARILARRGYGTVVFLAGKDFSKDAGIQLKRLPKGTPLVAVHTPVLWRGGKEKLKKCGLIIDALLGTGLSHPLKGHLKRVVEDINRMSKPVLAVDIPSGIDASNGRVFGRSSAIMARATVTFARPKIGHLMHPGAGHTGRLIVGDIGIPNEAIDAARPDTFLMDRQTAARLLPPRPDDSHKGTFGRSVILAGSRGLIGAAVLAAEAAMRAGSGLTELCVPKSIYSISARKLSPEAMCRPVEDFGLGAFSPKSLRQVLPILRQATAVLIGPGIGRHPKTIRWLGKLLNEIDPQQKIILDADALYAVAALGARPTPEAEALIRPAADIAVTPHAGEMSKLTGKGRAWIESNACSAARGFSAQHAVTVVLKGSRTLCAAPDGTVYINVTGNAALAKGATGDVLAGMICGLAAQGLSTFDAARLGVWLHGRAADIAVESGRDKRTILASDLFATLDPAFLELAGKKKGNSKRGLTFEPPAKTV